MQPTTKLRLSLHKETLKQLNGSEAGDLQAGGWSNVLSYLSNCGGTQTHCRTQTWGWNCKLP